MPSARQGGKCQVLGGWCQTPSAISFLRITLCHLPFVTCHLSLATCHLPLATWHSKTYYMKITVVIPIYGVEKFIGRCVESLMKQTLREVEYIFVDDCTPDRSIEILNDVVARFPERKEHVRILHHEVNKGLPAARNTGMAVAQGEYVFHCDSDDFLEPTMLEEMYLAAKAADADYVWCDWFLSYEDSERYMKMPEYGQADEAMKSMLAGGMKYNVWNKLVRRSLYVENDIRFPDGHSMGEDMTMIRLVACAKRVASVPKALYHYVRTNGEAMTQSMSERKIEDMKHNIASTIEFISKKKLGMDQWFGLFKLQAKYPFLISDDNQSLRYWKELYPESNRFIGQNPYESGRAMLLQRLAKHDVFWAIKLYYKIVYCIIYKVLYH